MRPAGRPELFGRDVRRIHCIGIGGMGVAPLAVYLAQSGFVVTGEDDALTDDVLARERVTVGVMPGDCELVVYSTAIAKTHPVYTAALAKKLPLVRRGEMLAEVLRARKLVAVCGSHGKTTTTAMLITALRSAGFPAGWVLGGLFADDTPPARTGSSDWVVAEIDESDGTIDGFAPELTVVVNLDWDHPDYYRREADLEATFAALIRRTRGPVLVSDACALSARVAGRANPSTVVPLSGTMAEGFALPSEKTFGRTGDFRGAVASETGGRMTIRLGGEFAIAEATVKAQGDFNVANATAALAAAQLMGATLLPALLADFISPEESHMIQACLYTVLPFLVDQLVELFYTVRLIILPMPSSNRLLTVRRRFIYSVFIL